MPPIPETYGPLCRLHRDPAAEQRLVCFPHAGGAHASFRRWAAQLDPAVELWVAELPGRGLRGGEPLEAAWTRTAGEFADGITSTGDGRPVTLLGHSLGALVAFETARRLDTAGTPPAQLLVIGARAPERAGPHWTIPAGDAELVDEVDRRYGAVPAVVRAEPELLRRFLPVLRADLELAAAYRYVPGAPLSCPVTAVTGTADPNATEAEQGYWRAYTTGSFRACTLPGGHFFLHDRVPEIGALAALPRAVTG